jgi:hypothetical protein
MSIPKESYYNLGFLLYEQSKNTNIIDKSNNTNNIDKSKNDKIIKYIDNKLKFIIDFDNNLYNYISYYQNTEQKIM